jgi:fructoselysine-6-P-deglycase FrlB-like protein
MPLSEWISERPKLPVRMLRAITALTWITRCGLIHTLYEARNELKGRTEPNDKAKEFIKDTEEAAPLVRALDVSNYPNIEGYKNIPEVVKWLTEQVAENGTIYLASDGSCNALVIQVAKNLSLGYRKNFKIEITLGKTMQGRLKKGDVVIMNSNSGKTQSLLTLAEEAKSVGAKTLCITTFSQRALGKIADYVIPLKGTLERTKAATKSVVVQTILNLEIIRGLIGEEHMNNDHYRELAEKFEKARKSAIPYEIVAEISQANRLVVVSKNGLQDESVLKLAETVYGKLIPVHMDNAKHGCEGAYSPGCVVLLVDPTQEEYDEIKPTIPEPGAKIVVLTSRGIQDDHSHIIPFEGGGIIPEIPRYGKLIGTLTALAIHRDSSCDPKNVRKSGDEVKGHNPDEEPEEDRLVYDPEGNPYLALLSNQQNTLPNICIVPKEPIQYLVQGRVHCGVYAAKGILSTYGSDSHNHPREYHVNWWNKLSGRMFPGEVVKVLRENGLDSQLVVAPASSPEETLSFLKHSLIEGKPIIMVIRNGYNREGKFSWFRYFLSWGHFMTIYGYDDEQELFYLYDSAVPKHMHKAGLPIGNTTRTFQETVRDGNTRFLGIIKPYTCIIPDESITE